MVAQTRLNRPTASSWGLTRTGRGAVFLPRSALTPGTSPRTVSANDQCDNIEKGLTNILVLYHYTVFITPGRSRKKAPMHAVWTISAAQKWPPSPQIFNEPGTKENEILCLIWGSMMLRCSKHRTQTLQILQKRMSLLPTKSNIGDTFAKWNVNKKLLFIKWEDFHTYNNHWN